VPPVPFLTGHTVPKGILGGFCLLTLPYISCKVRLDIFMYINKDNIHWFFI